jgi:CRP/FNR family transcriptional regulator
MLREGRLKVFTESLNGKVQILHILEKGNFFLNHSSSFPEGIEIKVYALEESKLCLFQKSVLVDIISKNPQISINMMESFIKRLRWFHSLITMLTLRNAEQKLASWLCLISSSNGKPSTQGVEVILPLARYDIANLLGVTQETISRRLAKFQAQGIIKLQGQRKIIIINYDKLQALIE